MTEIEIISAFKQAHAKLLEYRAIINPAADALADLQSIAVFGEAGHYAGYLGGYDNGIDSVFLHVRDDAPKKKDPPDTWSAPLQKAHRFRDEWRLKIGDECCVHLDGYG